MAELINLNKVRKARLKAEVQAKAGENRGKFGRTKAEKATEAVQQEKRDRDWSAHKREP